MNKRTVKIALWHQLNNIENKHHVHHDVMQKYEDSVFSLTKPTTQMRINSGIWTVSTELYGIEIICCADDVRYALRGVRDDIDYIGANLYNTLHLRNDAEVMA